jgi:hypothetical protein
VQEFIPGETLQELLRRLSTSGTLMPLTEAVQYTLDICEAAGYAHQRGMIHRDIKPANILLNVNGKSVLMDFGIVKITGDISHTATGAVVGTALYMPPEVIRGEVPDARADIYSLGVTFFEMISGRPPFEADSAMSLMMMHVRDPLPNMHHLRPDVPDELIAVVSKALAKEPNDRHSSMSDLAAALKVWLNQPSAGNTIRDEQAAEAAIASELATHLDEPLQRADDSVLPATLTDAETPASNPDSTIPVSPAEPVTHNTPVEDAAPAVPAEAVVIGNKPSEPVPAVSNLRQQARKGRHPAFWISLIAILLIVVASSISVVLALSNRGGDGGDKDTDQIVEASAANILAAGDLAAENPDLTPTATLPPTITPSPTQSPTPTFTPSPTLSATPTLSPTPTIPPDVPYVRINDIRLDEAGYYVVEYETFEFIEELPGVHIHFFFDTVPPKEAGSPGSGPWKLYGGPRPFTGYHQNQRPENAIQLCSLVANPDHSVQPDSGTCYDLPDIVVLSVQRDGSCLSGPDPAFPASVSLTAGQRMRGLGISPDEKWWFVAQPDNPGETCWLAQEISDFSGDISSLGLIEPPPLPEVPARSVEITKITIGEGGNYVVEYVTQGFEEQLPGTHMHFFFDTVLPKDIGIGGSGDRLMYGGPSPFTGYKVVDKPAAATELCVLVAEPNHSVILESGNCMPLP